MSWPDRAAHPRVLALALAVGAVSVLLRGPSVDARVGRPFECQTPILVDDRLHCDLEGAAAALGRPSTALRAGQAWIRGRPGEMAPGDLAALGVPIDPNTASVEALTSLPGVGPVTAARIVQGRPFARADDLRRVRGIGPRTLERMRPRLDL